MGRHVKYPLLMLGFDETWVFLTDIQRILKYQISWKSAQWERSCSMATDRQTDMTNLIVAFHYVANKSKNSVSCIGYKWNYTNESHILSTKLYRHCSSHNWCFLLNFVILSKIYLTKQVAVCRLMLSSFMCWLMSLQSAKLHIKS
jgi:hypothetical protein